MSELSEEAALAMGRLMEVLAEEVDSAYDDTELASYDEPLDAITAGIKVLIDSHSLVPLAALRLVYRYVAVQFGND